METLRTSWRSTIGEIVAYSVPDETITMSAVAPEINELFSCFEMNVEWTEDVSSVQSRLVECGVYTVKNLPLQSWQPCERLRRLFIMERVYW